MNEVNDLDLYEKTGLLATTRMTSMEVLGVLQQLSSGKEKRGAPLLAFSQIV
jgi:hypothetical protein